MKTLITIFLFVIAFAFDATVPEASGDLRWQLSFWLSVLAVGYGLYHVLTAKLSRPPIIFYPVLALAVIAVLSCCWSICPRWSLISLSRFLPYVVLFFAVYCLRDKNWYRTLLWAIAAGVGINCMIGIGQYYRVDIWLVNYFKCSVPPAGSLANRNLLASYLVLTLPVVVYLAWSARNWLERITTGVIIILGGLMLFYTDSRASWLAAGCEVVFFASWLLLRREKRLFTIALIIATVLAVGYALRNLPNDESFKIRAAYNINSLAIVKDHPLGVGVGAWKLAYPQYAYALVKTPPGGFGETLRPSRAHNDLMQAFVELGILGGLAYIVIFFMLIQTAWKTGGRMVLCLSTAVVGLGANALMDFPLQLPLAPIVFWTLAGVTVGLSKK